MFTGNIHIPAYAALAVYRIKKCTHSTLCLSRPPLPFLTTEQDWQLGNIIPAWLLLAFVAVPSAAGLHDFQLDATAAS